MAAAARILRDCSMRETRSAARSAAMRRQAMPSYLPPQLVMAWLPTRDVASALRVSRSWSGAAEPIFQAIAGRHGLRLVCLHDAPEPSWRATVRRYRIRLGRMTLRDSQAMVLLAAAQRDDVPAIQSILFQGANVNNVSAYGMTALHIAAMWGNLNALNALIAAGADLNAQNGLKRTEGPGGTPLHVAANSRSAYLTKRYHCAKRLIEAGANARLLNADEDAPYQSQFPEITDAPFGRTLSRQTFRKLLETAFRAQR